MVVAVAVMVAVMVASLVALAVVVAVAVAVAREQAVVVVTELAVDWWWCWLLHWHLW